MARSSNFGTFFAGGGGTSPCGNDLSDTPIAQLVIEKNQVPGNIGGSSLPGYDIKSQDSLTMMRLSLLALSDGSEFKEAYFDHEKGMAVTVSVGSPEEEVSQEGLQQCLYRVKTHEFVNKVDHVVVRGKDPLPKRSHGGSYTTGGSPGTFSLPNCGITFPAKNNSLRQEAWVELAQSPQSQEVQDALRDLIDRSKWEQLVAYKYRLPDLPPHISMSPSQTSPRTFSFPFGGIGVDVSLGAISSGPDDGGITDVSNVNVVAGPVLDIITGADVLALIQGNEGDAGVAGLPQTYGTSSSDYYVLLDHQCSLYSLSRGKEWFLNPGPVVRIRSAENTNSIAYQALGGINAVPGSTVRYFRRTNDLTIGDEVTVLPNSMSEFINYNANPPTDEQGNPIRPPTDPFNRAGGAIETTAIGNIEPGLGGNFGIELFDMQIAYTIQKSSIQLRSTQGDAIGAANALASHGIITTAIKIVDEPAPIGYNGIVVEQPAPPNDELEVFCPEPNPNVQALEGTIIDISAPFLSEAGVASFSRNIKDYIDQDRGLYENRTYAGGGYTWLPGQVLDNKTIHSIQYVYADKDSLTTNVTLGPKYFQANSYNDSQYVKRTETITRTGRVIAGTNSSGEFSVLVDGIGPLPAVNGMTDPVFPGDRVEVKVLNYPIEP